MYHYENEKASASQSEDKLQVRRFGDRTRALGKRGPMVILNRISSRWRLSSLKLSDYCGANGRDLGWLGSGIRMRIV